MGSIIFTTRSKEVSISGSERYHLNVLLGNISQSILNPRMNRDFLIRAIPSEHYLADSTQNDIMWAESFRTAMSVGDMRLQVNGEKISSLDIVLNTALTMGNDALKLAAAIDGQCEINAFIRGKNRSWMADIIENDNSGIFRTHKWLDLIEMLRESDEETVFMAYSVTDGILSRVNSDWRQTIAEKQNLDLDDWEVENRLEDEWIALGKDKHWELADAWADEMVQYGYELSPERWASDFYYGSGWNAGKIVEALEMEMVNEIVELAKRSPLLSRAGQPPLVTGYEG